MLNERWQSLHSRPKIPQWFSWNIRLQMLKKCTKMALYNFVMCDNGLHIYRALDQYTLKLHLLHLTACRVSTKGKVPSFKEECLLFLFSSSFWSAFSGEWVESAFSSTKSLQGFFLEPFGRPRFRFAGLAKSKQKHSNTDQKLQSSSLCKNPVLSLFVFICLWLLI